MIKPEWDYSDPAQLPLANTLRMYPQARVAQWRPGVHYSYTNAGAGLAGYYLELDTGKSYEDLLAQFVLEPLGMADTSALPPDGKRLAAGYDADGFSRIPYWHQIFRPFGAINSTLEDMSRFVRVFINRGTLDGERVFSADTIERVETPRTSLAARRGLTSGYGLGNYDWLRDGIRFQGHGGDADGYLSRLGYTLANNSGYFLVITAFQGRTLRAMRRLVEQYLAADLTPPDIPPALVLEQKDVTEITGRYRRLTYRFPAQAETVGREVLTIRFESGKLVVLDASGRARQLVPTATGLFRWTEEPRASQFIGRDESGEIYYLDGNDSWVGSAP
jgi:hypothetical protein